MKKKYIEIIARGVCIKNGRLLLCHSKGKWNTYLPGGHVEFGERAEHSLRREILEEMGLRARIGRFLGGVEHAYTRNGRAQCEINLIFEFTAPGLSSGTSPVSCEDYIEFLWAPLSRLGLHHLEPSVLSGLIPRWRRVAFTEQNWASTHGKGKSPA